MSRWRSKSALPVLPLVLGVSERGVAWLAPEATDWQNWDWPEDVDGPTAVREWVLNQAPQASATRQPVQVCLAPSLARHWVQSVPAQTASLSELHAVAAARAQQLWGAGPSGGWMVTGDWQAEGAFLCTAVPAVWEPVWAAMRARWGGIALHTPLLLAQQQGQTQWPQTGWLAVAVAQRLYVQRREAGRMVSLRSVRWPGASSLKTLQTLAAQEGRREMLRVDSGQENLHLLALFEGGDKAAEHESLKTLPWRPAGKMPTAPLDAPEAVQAAWCARQCLEGEGARHAA